MSVDRSVVKVVVGVLSAIVLCIVLLFGLMAWRNLREPVVNIPVTPLPNPNAFDLYVAAGKKLVRNKEIGDAVTTKSKHAWTLAEKEKLLADNRAAMKDFENGLTLSYRQPPVTSVLDKFPYYVNFRDFTRLKAMESRIFRERGQYGPAMNCALSATRFGNQIAEGGPLIGGLVSIACQAIGRYPAWDSIDLLTAREAEESTKQMEQIEVARVPFWHCLEEEKYYLEHYLLEVMRNPELLSIEENNNSKDKSTPASDESNETASPQAIKLWFFLYGKQKSIDNLSGYMDAYIERYKGPYLADRRPVPMPSDPFCQALLPVIDEAAFKARVNDTENALLLTSLGLRAYRVEQGHYPASLAELAPRYLTKLPDDPFAASGPLRYKRNGDKVVLYSAGPDGKDDGGKPIDNPKKTGRERFRPIADSKGDIVAGVNRG